jgi:hypothetical protein
MRTHSRRHLLLLLIAGVLACGSLIVLSPSVEVLMAWPTKTIVMTFGIGCGFLAAYFLILKSLIDRIHLADEVLGERAQLRFGARH